MKKLLVIIMLILGFGLPVVAQTTCKRHVEPAGGFSYCPPEGWTAGQDAGDKYKYFLRPDPQGSSANMNIKDEAFNGSLAEYVVAGMKVLLGNPEKFGAPNLRLLKLSDFVTASNQRGFKAIYQADYKGSQIRMIQYCFDGKPGMKLVITGTGYESEKDILDSIFDNSLKTFRLD